MLGSIFGEFDNRSMWTLARHPIGDSSCPTASLCVCVGELATGVAYLCATRTAARSRWRSINHLLRHRKLKKRKKNIAQKFIANVATNTGRAQKMSQTTVCLASVWVGKNWNKSLTLFLSSILIYCLGTLYFFSKKKIFFTLIYIYIVYIHVPTLNIFCYYIVFFKRKYMYICMLLLFLFIFCFLANMQWIFWWWLDTIVFFGKTPYLLLATHFAFLHFSIVN